MSMCMAGTYKYGAAVVCLSMFVLLLEGFWEDGQSTLL